MALGFSSIPENIFEMTIDRDSAIFLRAFSGNSQKLAGKSAASAGIDNPAGFNLEGSRWTFTKDLHRGGVGIFHTNDLCFFHDLTAALAGVIQKQFVEFRSLYLVGVFQRGTEILTKPESSQAGFICRAEFRAVFSHESGAFNSLPDTEFFEEAISMRKK